jgi:hypothetical protein
VDTTCWPGLDEKPDQDIDIRLHDGRNVSVPADCLIEQRDGSFYLLRSDELAAAAAAAAEPAPSKRNGHCWPCRAGPAPGQIGVPDPSGPRRQRSRWKRGS